MANIFTEIVKGLKWVGKEIGLLPKDIERVVAITDDVEADAATLFPELVTLVDDAGNLVTAAVKDGGEAITTANALVTAIVNAAEVDGLNIADDTAVAAAFETFITNVRSSSTWADVITALKKMTTDYDTFAGDVKQALAKLEADA